MKSFKESDVLEKFREMKVGMTVDSPLDEAKLPKARRAIQDASRCQWPASGTSRDPHRADYVFIQ